LLIGGESAGETDATGMTVVYGLLLWVGAPIVLVAVLPLLVGILKAVTKP
jgi:type III secretory pathway component EscS